MKKIYSLFAIAMTGCAYPHYYHPIETTAPGNNTGYKVSYLFEYGGCKVYRFYDIGNTVYYTNCGGDTIAYADSTQVKSTGAKNIKPVDISPYQQSK